MTSLEVTPVHTGASGGLTEGVHILLRPTIPGGRTYHISMWVLQTGNITVYIILGTFGPSLITDLRQNVQLLHNVPQDRVQTRRKARENIQWVCASSLLVFSPSSCTSLAPSGRTRPAAASVAGPPVHAWAGDVTCWQTVGVVTAGDSLSGR